MSETELCKHGRTRIQKLFAGMKSRCYNSNNMSYPRYGGRGIAICDEWLENPESFYEWAMEHGYRCNLSIDRIDNDRGYAPDNCRFISLAANSSKGGAKIDDVLRDLEEVERQGIFMKHHGEIGVDIFDAHQTPKWLVDYPTGYDPKTGQKIATK